MPYFIIQEFAMSRKHEKNDEKSITKRVKNEWWDKMFIAVLGVVKYVKEKNRTEDLPDGFFKNRAFFEHIGFFEDLKSSYKGVEVIKDTKNKKICLKGRGDKFGEAYSKCEMDLNKLKKKEQVLKDARMCDIIKNNDAYVKKIMASKGIKAKVCIHLLVLMKLVTSNSAFSSKQAEVLFETVV